MTHRRVLAYLWHEEQDENSGSQYEDGPSQDPGNGSNIIGIVDGKQCYDSVHHADHDNEEN